MTYYSKGVTLSPKGQVATIDLDKTDNVIINSPRVKRIRFVGQGTLGVLNVEKTSIKELDITSIDVTSDVFVPYGTVVKDIMTTVEATSLDMIPSYQCPVIPKPQMLVPDTIFDYGTTPTSLNEGMYSGDAPTTASITNRPNLDTVIGSNIELNVAEDSLLRKFLTLGVLNNLIPTNTLNRVNLEAMLFNLVEVGADDYGNASSVGLDLVNATKVPPVKLSMYIAALCILTPYTPWTLSQLLSSAINKTMASRGLF